MFKKGQIVRLVKEPTFIWSVNIPDESGEHKYRRPEIGELFRVTGVDSHYLELQSFNKGYWVGGLRYVNFEAL